MLENDNHVLLLVAALFQKHGHYLDQNSNFVHLVVVAVEHELRHAHTPTHGFAAETDG